MSKNLPLPAHAASLILSLFLVGTAGCAADAPSAATVAAQPPASRPPEPAAMSARLFTPEEIAQHKEVVVMTNCLVGADGHAKDCYAERNSGEERFAQAAVKSMLAQTFVPAKAADGTPTESRLRVQYRFRAKDGPPPPAQ